MPLTDEQSMIRDMARSFATEKSVPNPAARRRESRYPEEVVAKLYASEIAEEVCSDVIQIHGGCGYRQDFPVERISRDVRVTKIYEGTSDIQRLIICRDIAVA